MREPPQVVLDTNVFVAAAFDPASQAAAVVAAVERGELALVWDEATRRETEAVLRRIPPLRSRRFAHLFTSEHKYRGSTDATAFPEVEDPSDRKFAALAAATGACLVTNDRHLLARRRSERFEVTTPASLTTRR